MGSISGTKKALDARIAIKRLPNETTINLKHEKFNFSFSNGQTGVQFIFCLNSCFYVFCFILLFIVVLYFIGNILVHVRVKMFLNAFVLFSADVLYKSNEPMYNKYSALKMYHKVDNLFPLCLYMYRI